MLVKEEVIPKRIRRQALKKSLHEAGSTGASASIGELYAVPFSSDLGAQPVQIGLLTALSGVVAPFAQLYGTRLLEQGGNRKKIVLTFTLLQALMWIPIATLAIALHFGYLANASATIFIILYTLLIALGNITFPAWFSWIGGLSTENERGKYFSLRNKIIGIIGLIVVLASAFVIDVFRSQGYLLLGFAILFAIATTFRLYSLITLKNQYAPSFKTKQSDHFSFISFLKRMDNFGKFTIYLALFNAALMIASPFFAIYMLEELKFSYVTLMLVTLSSTLVYLLTIPLMGRLSDKYGNKRLLQIANVAFIFSPMPWMIIRDPILLIIIPQLFAGIANAAFVIGTTNFTYDSVSPRHRPLCVAYSNIMVGVGTFVGALLGGFILKYYNSGSEISYILLFGIASFLRFLVAFIYLPKIKEIKHVKKFPSPDLNVLRPTMALQHDLTWIKKVFRTT